MSGWDWGRRLRTGSPACFGPPPSPTSTSPTTFGAHGADEQLRPALRPPSRGQHGQRPRGALTHEQSHFAADSTLMQAEPASRCGRRDQPEARREMEF